MAPAAPDAESLQHLVEAVKQATKYRCISDDLVQHIAVNELAKRPDWRAALKATKRKLHQVTAAYVLRSPDYTVLLSELRGLTVAADHAALRAWCRQVMGQHSSTRERLGILDEFYATTLASLGQVHSVLDVACGLNPLALPWMPLTDDAEYYAYDVCEDLAGFLDGFFAALGIAGTAVAQDVTLSPPTQHAQLALLLKSLPCLEQIDPQAGLRLLQSLRVEHMLVSFPVHSLGGRNKGMSDYYEQHFLRLLAGQPWQVQRFSFSSEIAFLVSK